MYFYEPSRLTAGQPMLASFQFCAPSPLIESVDLQLRLSLTYGGWTSHSSHHQVSSGPLGLPYAYIFRIGGTPLLLPPQNEHDPRLGFRVLIRSPPSRVIPRLKRYF